MRDQKGFTLIEVLIAVMLIGVIAAAFLGAVSSSSRVLLTVDQREKSRNYAEYQIEFIKTLPYATSYTPAATPSAYSGLTAAVTVTNIAADKQQITVEIIGPKIDFSLSDYRVNY